MTQSDDTPYETPNHEAPVVSNYSDKVNRQIYFKEQETIDAINRKEQ